MQIQSVSPGARPRPLDAVPGAVLYSPAPGEHVPGTPTTIVLAGSTGGGAGADALARSVCHSGGHAVALPYFGAPGLPVNLERIRVETVHDAARAVGRELPFPDIALIGISRGAELALLAASSAPELITGPVIAVAPSSVVWPGHTDTTHVRPAWTLGGEVVPYAVPGHGTSGLPTTAAGVRCTPMYEATLRETALWAHAVIEVERIAGPLVLAAGDDDGLWPAQRFAAIARSRRLAAGRAGRDQHLLCAGAGHGIGRPGAPAAPTSQRHPVSGMTFDLGGSAAANTAAADAWWRLAIRVLGLAA